MRIERFETGSISRCWPWLGDLLRPSIEYGGGRTVEDVKTLLMDGQMGIASVHVPHGVGLVVLHPAEFDGKFCCWVPYIVAKVKTGPRDWVRVIQQVMGHFEDQARLSGCAEMRIGGRDWSRILVGYERFDDVPNRLRKIL